MGKFDDQIAWCKQQIEEERRFIEPLEKGTLYLKEKLASEIEWTDATQRHIEKGRTTIRMLEQLIAEIEPLNV